MKNPILVLLCALLASGCFVQRAHRNNRIDPSAVAQLVPGETTARQVVELLGAPTDVVQLANRSAYRYDFVVEKQATLFLVVLILRGIESNSDRVWVFFDANEVLSHVGTIFESGVPGYHVPIFSSGT